MQETILEIIKITLPAIIVMIGSVLIVKSYVQREFQLRKLNILMNNQKEITPIRLQAYERLSLFLERISPNNLIQRVRKSDMTGKELQIGLLSSIRAEYEHNISQQIYVTPQTWDAVCIVKDESVKMINLIATSMPKTASSLDLSRAILDYYMQSEDILPHQRALDVLKGEVQKLFL